MFWGLGVTFFLLLVLLFSRRVASHSCETLRELPPDPFLKIYSNPALLLCSLGWTLVFKAVSGADKRAYAVYNDGNTYAESEMDALDVTNKYPNDYKNRIILQWRKFNPSEVSN